MQPPLPLLLLGALLGLVWTSASLAEGPVGGPALPGAAGPVAIAPGNGRCNTPPCTCNQFGWLTCDCKDAAEELILTAEGERGLSRHTSRIVVNDCPSVVLMNHSLAQMDGLLSVDLVNVANLTLSRHSFKLSPRAVNVRLTLRNASLDVLPSNVFHGDVEAVLLKDARIGQLSAFAFANLVNTNSITLEDCWIEELQALAFKKFEVNFLHVIGGSLGREVPSRAVNDVEVSDMFRLDGVRMGLVRSSAFVLKRPKTVAIQNCAIESLESQAFDIGASGTVIIKNNSFGSLGFGAFLSIHAHTENRLTSAAAGGLYSLRFESNNLSSFEEGSLLFDRSSFRAELSQVLVTQACDCELLALWRNQILNYTNAHSRLLPGARDGDPVLAPPHSLESGAEDPEAFLCLEEVGASGSTPASFADFEARHCTRAGSLIVLAAAACGLLLLLLLIGCLLVHCRRRRGDSRKRWISVPTSAPDVVSKAKNGLLTGRKDGTGSAAAGAGAKDTGGATAAAAPVDSRITMVVPDGRLYRETEFHVIVEKAEPLTTEL